MPDRQARYETRRKERGGWTITVRLDADTLAALERLAMQYGGDRSAAIRAILLTEDRLLKTEGEGK